MASSLNKLSQMIRVAIAHASAKQSVVVAITLMVATVQTAKAQDSSQKEVDATDSAAIYLANSGMPDEYGVLLKEPRAFSGYNLITASDNATYLFDNEGRVVHSWPSNIGIGDAYLLDNGHLFRRGSAANLPPRFRGPGKHGRFQELDWDGNLLWDFEYVSDKRQPHHDAIKLPNGNVLTICWEMIEADEAIAQGVWPKSMKDVHLQPDCLVEIKPTGLHTGEVVWEWRTWDHLIQDYDRTKPSYGNVADHPERINANTGENDGSTRNPDWMHVNAVAYNPSLDQIALSSPSFSEIWIIDHSTTTEEARGHTGGRWGKGGDILYRWGNPRSYRRGTTIDRRLFSQHNIHWIAKGLPGESHLLVFNNGGGREPKEHSSVDEFAPPIDNAGNYIRQEHASFGPDTPLWSYTAPNKSDFYSWFISGAQRLPNGNTLINAGAVGVVFEVTPEKEIVWKFANPFPNEQPNADVAPRPFQVVPNDARNGLGMSEEQLKQLDELGDQLNSKLDEVLTTEQKRILTGPDDAPLSTVPAGEYLWAFNNKKLNLTEDQAASLQAVAHEFNPRIASILTEGQRLSIQNYKEEQAQRQQTRRPTARNTLFRAMRFGLDHPAFAGRTLTPGKTACRDPAGTGASCRRGAMRRRMIRDSGWGVCERSPQRRSWIWFGRIF